MNTISKAFVLAAVLLTGCVQGPWSFWPNNPARYAGVWVYAQVVAGQAVTQVCFEPTIPLTSTVTNDFAFYDSAHVQISGPFSGKDTTFVLQPISTSPNCFDGPADLRAQAASAYQFDAVIRWDSVGHTVTSHFTASTNTPTQFGITKALAPAVANLEPLFRDSTLQDTIRALLGDSLYALHANPAAWDTFLGQNQYMIYSGTMTMKVPYQSGDTVDYLKPVKHLDFLGHTFVTHYSNDVRGILMTEQFNLLQDSMSTSTFSSLINSNSAPDSSREWRSGTQRRLSFTSSTTLGSGTNRMDSLGYVSLNFLLGPQRFYFYGVEQDYSNYEQTAVASADDPRVVPVSNIKGGQGYFAGMLVDSFDVFVRSLPGMLAYPIARDQILYCRATGWDSDTMCRSLQWIFCADSLSAAPDCRTPAIVTALDSGLAWDAKMLPMSATPVTGPPAGATVKTGGRGSSGWSCPYGQNLCLTETQVQTNGERMDCIRNNFAASKSYCASYKQDCQVSADTSVCKRELWDFCSDRQWNIDSLPQCGPALVSWMRINKVLSIPFQRVRDSWCAAHSSDLQCGF